MMFCQGCRMDPINLFSDRSGGLFAVLAFFSVFSDFLLSIFSLYYLTFVCRSKNSPPDCFLNGRLQIPCPPEFAVKKLQIPVWVSVILAEDKGFEVTRIGCCFISQHGSFRYFMPFSMYFSTHSNTSFLFVKEHEKEHRKPYQAQVV